jgi:regulator of protease activity HflC (stomatin/prohibitin superfamily)
MTAATRAVRTKSEQRPAHVLPGLPLAIAVLALAIAGVLIAIVGGSSATWIAGAVLVVIAALAVPGFFVLQPNASMVLILFGRYQGTEDRDGLWWTNPLTFIWRVRSRAAYATSRPSGSRSTTRREARS